MINFSGLPITISTVFFIGPFEKFTKVTMILPLTGQQYAAKVSENCVAFWKSVGLYTDAEAKAIETFNEVLKNETFPPGSSILFTHSPHGALTVSICCLWDYVKLISMVKVKNLMYFHLLHTILGLCLSS